MEFNNSSRGSNRGIEENTMAILDSSGIKEARDLEDDRLTFIEAVRAASLVPESGFAPTSKMYEAILQILEDSTSLELIMSSYQLLTELSGRFPRVYLSNLDASMSNCDQSVKLVVVEEAWSPLSPGSENAYTEREANSRNLGSPLHSSAFSLLTQNIAKMLDNCQVSDPKDLGKMLLLQYLVNVLEQDFLPRKTVYKATMNWTLVKESSLNILLGSRRMSYKSFIKDCLTIISKGSMRDAALRHDDLKNTQGSSGKVVQCYDVALATSLMELQKGTCMCVQKFTTLIMELDVVKKEADIQGYTSRADGSRTPLVEIILDELTYDEDLFRQFLEVFSEPKWKLEIILRYFWKYITKPSIRTRRSTGSTEDATFDSVLRCFSSDTSTRSIVKKIGTEVSQLLLAHAFQAYVSRQHHVKHIPDSTDDVGSGSHLQICKDLISAFHSLKKADKHMEITSMGKGALFTAATIIKSQGAQTTKHPVEK